MQARRRDFTLIAAFYALFVSADFGIARAIPPAADAMQNANEAGAVLSGNIFLHGWVLALDNFYLTDLPLYVLGQAFFGAHLWLIYAIPAVNYALLLAAAVLLVLCACPQDAPAWPGALAILVLIGLPFQPGAQMLLISDFHTATIMFSLYAILAIQPVLRGEAFARWRFVPFTLLLFAAAASDPMAAMFLALPLFALLAFRLVQYRGLRRDEVLLTACTLAACLWAADLPAILLVLHGFTMRPSFSTGTVRTLPALLINASAVLASLRILFNALPAGLAGIAGGGVFAASRLLVEVAVMAASLLILLRLPRGREAGIAQLLALAAFCLAGLDALSATFFAAVTPGPGFPNAAVRYVAPVFVFLSIAAAIAMQDGWNGLMLHRRLAATTACLFGAIFLFAAGQAAAAAALAPAGVYAAPQYQAAQWLLARGLRYGVGDYYTTELLRALSLQQLMADPMTVAGGLVPMRFWTDTSRFDAHERPQFVIFPPVNWYGITSAAAEKTYGPPLRVTQIDGFTVLMIKP